MRCTLAAYESVRVAAPTYVDAHGGAAASGDWPDITAVRLDLPANGDDDAVAFRPDTAPGGSLGVGHLEMARRLAMAGMGAAVLPAYLVDADLVAGTLVRVAPIRPLAPVTLKLAHAHRASAGRYGHSSNSPAPRSSRRASGPVDSRGNARPPGSGLVFHGSSSTNERSAGRNARPKYVTSFAANRKRQHSGRACRSRGDLVIPIEGRLFARGRSMRVERVPYRLITAQRLPFSWPRAEKESAPPPQTPEVGIVTVQPQAVPAVTELPGRTSAFLVAQVRAGRRHRAAS